MLKPIHSSFHLESKMILSKQFRDKCYKSQRFKIIKHILKQIGNLLAWFTI